MKKKLLSVILALTVLLTGTCSVLAAAVCQKEDCEMCPTIIVPGIFQSEVKMYDEDGNVMKNSEGEEYEKPFFMEATSDVVKTALKEALLPIMGELITQQDKKAKAAQKIADVLGEVVLKNVKCDENGDSIQNLRATEYNTSVADLSEYDREYCLDMIPLQNYIDVAGADHLFYFSYVSTDNIYKIAGKLYDLIQIAKQKTGHDKVNIVPISQGGSIFNALMQLYKDNGRALSQDINRVCFIVPAADGAAVLGDIYHYGLLDDDEALYGYMFPELLDDDQEWLSYLITLLLRMFPNDGINKLLDAAVDTIIADYLSYSTAIWALIPSKDYPDCREKYLTDEAHANIVKQTDWYYYAQTHAKDYIAEAQSEGVEFFDVVDYDFELYKIVDSWDKVNADGIIHTESESFGATAAPVGCSLPEGYVQQNTYCTNPEHNHMDSTNTVDASTGLLCETTFYFKGQDHERTANNDVIIRLAVRILTDESFENVYSDPAFPQFNYARNVKSLKRLYKAWEKYYPSDISAELREEYNAAMAQAKQALDSTVMTTEEFDAAYDRLNKVTYIIGYGTELPEEEVSTFVKMITNLFKKLSEFLLRWFGGKGYSDIILFR